MKSTKQIEEALTNNENYLARSNLDEDEEIKIKSIINALKWVLEDE